MRFEVTPTCVRATSGNSVCGEGILVSRVGGWDISALKRARGEGDRMEGRGIGESSIYRKMRIKGERIK